MQRGTSYGIDAAYPDSLQPSLLRVYRWTSDVWHKFLDETQNNNDSGRTLSASTDTSRDSRPRKRQRTDYTTTHLRTPASCGTTLLSTPISVDMSPLTADDTVGSILVRSTSPFSAGAEECGTLQDLPRDSDSANLLTPAISMPTSSEGRSSASTRVDPLSIPAVTNPTRRGEQLSISRQFAAPRATFAGDRDTRAAAGLTDVDVLRKFEYLEEFKLLVCKSHGYAVRNVKRHLEEQHRETKAVNRAVAQRLTDLEIRDPRTADVPTGPVAPFPSLSPPVSGFFCGDEDGKCGFLSTSSQSLSRHWKATHGASKGSERLKYQRRVELQSFTPMRNDSRRFVVDSRIIP